MFKLLKPDIEARLGEDLEILGALGDFLDVACERYRLPALNYRDTFDTIRDLLLHEVRLTEEQEHMAEAANIYAASPGVLIPRLFPFCSTRLTAMERVRGHCLLHQPPALPQARRQLGLLLAQALIAAPIFSPSPAALFHADPHGGNLLLTPGGKVGLIDWSLAGRLHKASRVQLAQLLLGALAWDTKRMRLALEGLRRYETPSGRAGVLQTIGGDRAPNRISQTLEAGVRLFRCGALPGVSWLTRLFDNLSLQTGLVLDGDLLLFRKSLLTLQGVLSDLLQPDEAQAVLDQAAWTTFWRCWSAEWPLRWIAPLQSRSFATHLSTADHFYLAQSMPAAFVRWWREALPLGQARRT